MNRMLIVAPLAAFALAACVVAPPGHGGAVMVAPALPLVVELGTEPYYSHGGYYYHYYNNGWRYSNARSGPWIDLPRSHYPRETHFRGRPDDRGGDRDRDRDHDRGRDGRDRDRR
jgi:hypothetical protein